MNPPLRHIAPLALLVPAALLLAIPTLPAPGASALNAQAESWRTGHRLMDLHQHINYTTQHLARALGIMDAAGLGIGVNLSGGTVTRKGDAPSEFEKNKARADGLFPGRFLHYMNLDYAGWDDPDFSSRAVAQVEEGRRLGAAGLKEFKRLGLYLRDGKGELIKIDDPKLDAMWRRCGELGMPVSIHVSDPLAFWLPYNDNNERWTELKDHKAWWFGDPKIFPPREALHAARNRMIAKHPGTTFVCVHFANNPEDIGTVDRWLDTHPNMRVDLAARVPELGRHDPQRVHDLFVKHQDRIVFATDFMVYDRMTLGSGGSGPAPTDEDARSFYEKHWRWLETRDKDFEHMTPIQGDWTISGIGLPASVLRKIYFDNTRKLLARSLPKPVLKAARVQADFELTGDLGHAGWQRAVPARMEYGSKDYAARPEVSTVVRALWSDRFLYLGYRCPFTRLTQFEPPRGDGESERLGLWDRDVVEAFIGSDWDHINRYTEFEVAPTNEKLDLILDLPARDFEWSSGFESRVTIDEGSKVWTCEMRIPLKAISMTAPKAGTRWRLNLYRCDQAQKAFLAWSPTLQGGFHAPEQFGALEFSE
jgi:predicted TIM-barrel fold metal-dependent hydrolase